MNAPFVYAIAGMAALFTLLGAVRLFGRRPTEGGTEEESPLEIVSRTRAGFGGELVLVRFEGRRFLLGVTRGQWTALADLGRAAERKHADTLSAIDAELNRALHSDRMRRGRKAP